MIENVIVVGALVLLAVRSARAGDTVSTVLCVAVAAAWIWAVLL